MIEFFQNVWQGILNNKDAIIVALSSAEFAGLVVAIYNLIVGSKNTANNTLANNALSSAISTNIANVIESTEKLQAKLDAVVEDNVATRADVLALTEELRNTKNELAILTETDNLILYKLDSILEVQSLAYSTLRDVNTRNAILSVLSTAKHTEATHMTDIAAQLEQMKADIANKMHEVDAAVADGVKKAETILHVVDNAATAVNNIKNAQKTIHRG